MKLTQDEYYNVGLIFVFLLIGLYLYRSPDINEEKNLILIKGTLAEEPIFTDTGGDVPHDYVEIKLLDDSRNFVMKSCCYDELDKEKTKMLTFGDTIDIYVRKTRSFSEKVNKEYDIFRFNSPKYGHILKLEDVNKCNLNSWKIGPIGALVFGLFFVWSFGKRIKNRILKNNNR